jgi:BirA family biotin operon repressor/biotin-[acetyl-CoA-carboxylase] ligase
VADPRYIPGELLARLARFGRVYLLDSVTSTNEYALSLSARHEPAIVLAERQTAGRGRFRRHWYSDPDSLTFSLLVFFDDPEDPSLRQLTQLVALSICRAIESRTGLRPGIRWPNDIVLEDGKVCGILCEQRKEAVAVGCGINVNQTGFAEELELPEATSLRIAAGREFEQLELLDALLTEFTRVIEDARTERLPALLAEIRARSAILHRRAEIRTLLRRHIGTVVDIDSEGRAVLRTDSGRLVVVSSGQVRSVRCS